jgi:hypothetical protein
LRCRLDRVARPRGESARPRCTSSRHDVNAPIASLVEIVVEALAASPSGVLSDAAVDATISLALERASNGTQ